MISITERRVRIEIKDLPKGIKVTREEMRKVTGGIGTWPTPEKPFYSSSGLYLPISTLSPYSMGGGGAVER